MTRIFLVLAAAILSHAAAAEPPAGQAEFRELYRQLVELNTTLSSGSCTRAAELVSDKLQGAGFEAADIHIVVPPEFPTQGNLVALLDGSNAALKPLVLLGHLDVVEAKREDWERDPFTLVEEDGYFWGRGSVDDKSMAAIFVDAMMRYKRDAYRPPRGIKLVLTCGEETPGTFDGAKYLVDHHRDLVDGAFAINEAAKGELDERGRRVFLGVQGGEKVYQDIRLEITNPGGHSSIPLEDNAIYRLAHALGRIEAYAFPVELNGVTRAFFERMSDIARGRVAADMRAILATPPDSDAMARLLENPSYNSILHTTCVATQLEAGHAPNALPQRAAANINCRILPGHRQQDILETLRGVVADPGIELAFAAPPESVSPPPELTGSVLEPIEAIAADMWPGVPVVPIMLAGATDARFLTPAGIPTYGVSGLFVDPLTVHTHGLNERIGVAALYEGREFLDRLIRAYAERP